LRFGVDAFPYLRSVRAEPVLRERECERDAWDGGGAGGCCGSGVIVICFADDDTVAVLALVGVRFVVVQVVVVVAIMSVWCVWRTHWAAAARVAAADWATH
jgi:hypothetical protein